MRTLAVALSAALLALGASAAPIYPTIGGHDFNFGGHNSDPTFEYMTNGVLPDTLTYTPNGPGYDHEVTAYWPNWPAQPALPVWDLGGLPNFGGDLILGMMFTGQDAPYSGPGGVIDVSLTGHGFKVGQASADLEIWGTIYLNQNVTFQGLLWAMDIEKASLYGYSNQATYVVEGVGAIVGALYRLYPPAGCAGGRARPPRLHRPASGLDPAGVRSAHGCGLSCPHRLLRRDRLGARAGGAEPAAGRPGAATPTVNGYS